MDTSKVDSEITPWTIHDISSEEYRIYHYEDGTLFVIPKPKALYILATGSHRIVTEGDITYRPERGWVGISWKSRDGEAPFNF